jgi:hypothetical protein
MQSQPSYQCDICFQPYAPFTMMRVLPVTPIITLSGTATPMHVRIPGAILSVCRYCRASFSNLEPYTDPVAANDTPEAPDVPDNLVHPASPVLPDASVAFVAPEALSLTSSQPIPEVDPRLRARPSLFIPSLRLGLCQPLPFRVPARSVRSTSHHHATPGRRVISATFATFVTFITFPLCLERVRQAFLHRETPVRSVTFASFASFATLPFDHASRSPPPITQNSPYIIISR